VACGSIGAIGASSYIGILTRTAFFMSLISGSTIPGFLKVLGTVLSGAQRSALRPQEPLSTVSACVVEDMTILFDQYHVYSSNYSSNYRDADSSVGVNVQEMITSWII